MVDCHSDWLNISQFWFVLRLWFLFHLQSMWLCHPLTIPIPLSCTVSTSIPKCIPRILFYPIRLITLPEDASPWMNHGFLPLLVKMLFHTEKKNIVLGKTKKGKHQWSWKFYVENKSLSHINMLCCWISTLLMVEYWFTVKLYLGLFVILFVFYHGI